MGRRGRARSHAAADAAKSRGESAAPAEPGPGIGAAEPGGDGAAPRRSRLTATPVAWLVLAGIAVAVAIAALMWQRQRFDMVKTLASIAEKEGAWDNPWDLQQKKIANLKSDLASETDPIKRLIAQRELAQQYVYGGASEAAIALLDKLLAEYGKSVPARDIETLKGDQALAYFRLGELQNCTWNHNSDSCIFPVKNEGVHKEQLGAAEAARRLGELLSDPTTDPENALCTAGC